MKIEVYSPTIRRKEMDAVLTAMVQDRVGPGELARSLVQIAREHIQFDYCLALRSPAIALSFALRALNLEDGAGVLVSALSPRYYPRVLEELRLRPVYCDVSSGSAVMSAETVTAALERAGGDAVPRCIVVNHTLGFVPDAAAICALGLPVIEDCSQSYGTSVGEQRAGSFGALAILGLEERDMLTAGGGALLYAVNRRDAGALRALSPFPEYSLPDLNAAMAIVQFRESARNLEKRKLIGEAYIQPALRTRHKVFVQGETAEKQGIEYNYYAFPLILETGMKDVKAYAKKKDIIVESAFDETIVGSGGIPPELCTEAYSLSLRTALFPLYPRLTGAETEKVSKLILTLP
ncbi:MAG: DegT/DnrJ/EryC1/StrS family aminotransferase [Treponema sp.]|jgi:dTDP-4-amino-4,6-dideoxygalactose transaminase|nr:DegT/DnrJ/EryC1/StrS family aminotransferase [Treponema sp.]